MAQDFLHSGPDNGEEESSSYKNALSSNRDCEYNSNPSSITEQRAESTSDELVSDPIDLIDSRRANLEAHLSRIKKNHEQILARMAKIEDKLKQILLLVDKATAAKTPLGGLLKGVDVVNPISSSASPVSEAATDIRMSRVKTFAS
uniref:Uncharacterized protein n=1 Tax=Nelumbo nucifera TaxID=4432 RepID=A0A822ZAN9_NELNU|nr:TPA_asm: hypothetical protein HUJ06_021196 [Nelumbo nucifera]DAD41977.1 TPA_asm: hypothetical protein HUJ06_016300 [Nelumbo nucifera]